MRSRLVIPTLLVTAVVVIAAGCGGSSKKSAAPPATTPAATATQSTATATTATKTAVPATFASTKNCAQLTALGAKMSEAMQAASGKGGSGLTGEAQALQALASAAPSEIRGDFETFATAFNGYAQALTKAGYKPGSVPNAGQIVQLSKAVKVFSAPNLRTAEQHLAAWARTNCTAG